MTEPTWADYREAGMPYGKQGFVKWIKEKYDAEAEQLRAKLGRASWLARQTLDHLPKRRDWLDPNIEHELKALAQNAATPAAIVMPHVHNFTVVYTGDNGDSYLYDEIRWCQCGALQIVEAAPGGAETVTLELFPGTK